MTNQSETESTISKIADDVQAKGKPFATNVRQIPNFPFESFDALIDAFRQRTILLQRFSYHYENSIFELFASQTQVTLNTLYIALAFLLPLTSIVLAFVYSWWWLAGIPSMFLGL